MSDQRPPTDPDPNAAAAADPDTTAPAEGERTATEKAKPAAKKRAARKAAASTTEPAAQPTTEPAAEPAAEPTAEPVAEPAAEAPPVEPSSAPADPADATTPAPATKNAKPAAAQTAAAGAEQTSSPLSAADSAPAAAETTDAAGTDTEPTPAPAPLRLPEATPVPPGDRRGLAAGLAVALVLLIYVAINLLASDLLRGARLDLTADRLYTLSPLTEQVLGEIDEPVRLDFVYSRRLAEEAPALAAHATRVRELLAEYAARADGGLIVREIDPLPFSAAEDRVMAYGLLGVPVGPANDPAYFGLIGTNMVDDEHVIPFLQPERGGELEYDVTRLIHRLANPERLVVGLLSGLPLAGGPAPAGLAEDTDRRPFAIYSRLDEAFDLRLLAAGIATLSDDIDVLMLVHPRDLPAATLYAIDQYLMRGGRAVVLIDPNSEAEARRRAADELFSPTYSSLGPFAESWGLTMDVEQVAGDLQAAMRVSLGTGPTGRPDMVDYLAWLRLGQENFNGEDRITAQLNRIGMASAGVLEPLPGARTSLTPLIETSRHAQALDVARASFNPNPRQLLADFTPGGVPLMLAARVTGPAASAFPEGPPDGWSGPTDHLAEARRPLDLVVIADTDLLEDRLWVEIEQIRGETMAVPFADNDMLVINAVEALSGALDLSGLRARATADRPFDRIEALERAAAERYRETEQRLLDELSRAEAQLRDLEAVRPGGQAGAISLEERRTLDEARRTMVAIRAELRDVQRDLRQDVERLKRRLVFLNVALIPLLLVATMAGWALLRRSAWWRGRRTPPRQRQGASS